MMNLCSLSKIKYAILATGLLTLCLVLVQLIEQNWVNAGIGLLPLVGTVVAYRSYQTLLRKMELCIKISSEASQGQLDARIINLGETGTLRLLANNINRILDLTEAFTKEANTAMEYANQRRYFRKIIPTGLRGSYIFYANTINKSLELMATRDGEFKNFVNTQVVSVANIVSAAATELSASASNISHLSAETGKESIAAAGGAQTASSNVQAVAAAVEEFAASTSEIAQQATRVAEISRGAVEALAKSDGTVSRLSEATDKIGGVLALISTIAEQTKLLALNATIEAARAGEMGKGFAVVASEVKALAEQTARATDDIADQVGQMQSISKETVTAMQGTGQAVRKISEAASTVAAAAEEQKAASSEIARNLSEAVSATQIVSNSISKVESAAQETANGIHEVSAASEDLSKHASKLLSQVASFLSKLGKAA